MRIRTLPDLLASIPFRLGYEPAGSLVLLGLQADADSMRAGPSARLDTAELTDRGPELVARVISALVAHGADVLLPVLYSGRGFQQARHDPDLHHAFAVVEEVAAPAGTPAEMTVPLEGIGEAWLVAADAWGHLLDCGCCPPDGLPRAWLEESEVAAAMVVRGRVIRGSREELAVRPVADGDARRRAHRAWQDEAGAALGSPAWCRKLARLWDRHLAPEHHRAPEPEVLGRLLRGLEDSRLRDAALAAALCGGSTGAYLDPAALARGLDAAVEPEARRTGPVQLLAERVASHAPAGRAAPALALLAYLAWWTDDPARADVLAAQALDEDPEHRLAGLVRTILGRAVPPPWLRGAVPCVEIR